MAISFLLGVDPIHFLHGLPLPGVCPCASVSRESALICRPISQLGLILLTQPFGEWWAAPRHKYDFVVTIMLVFVSILWVLPQVHIEGIVLRIFNILRVLRLLVVLMKIDKVSAHVSLQRILLLV